MNKVSLRDCCIGDGLALRICRRGGVVVGNLLAVYGESCQGKGNQRGGGQYADQRPQPVTRTALQGCFVRLTLGVQLSLSLSVRDAGGEIVLFLGVENQRRVGHPRLELIKPRTTGEK